MRDRQRQDIRLISHLASFFTMELGKCRCESLCLPPISNRVIMSPAKPLPRGDFSRVFMSPAKSTTSTVHLYRTHHPYNIHIHNIHHNITHPTACIGIAHRTSPVTISISLRHKINGGGNSSIVDTAWQFSPSPQRR